MLRAGYILPLLPSAGRTLALICGLAYSGSTNEWELIGSSLFSVLISFLRGTALLIMLGAATGLTTLQRKHTTKYNKLFTYTSKYSLISILSHSLNAAVVRRK